MTHASVQRVAGPINETLTLDQAKSYLRVEHADDDEDINAFIRAAREQVEDMSHYALGQQTFEQRYDLSFFPDVFIIDKKPLVSVSSIKYRAQDGTEKTVSSSVYVVDTYTDPARIYTDYEETWPSDVRGDRNGIILTYISGIANPQDVPERLFMAMRLLVSHFYETRDIVVYQQTPMVVRRTLDLLLGGDRLEVLI